MKAITNTDKFLERISNQLDELLKQNASGASQTDLDGRWTCDICGKEFASEKSLKMHKTKVHK